MVSDQGVPGGAPVSRAWLPELWQHDLRRRFSGLAVAFLLLLSTLLPHIAVVGVPGSRTLMPTSAYFLSITNADLGVVGTRSLGLGLNLTYVGLGMQQFGLVLAAVSVWIVFGGDEVNRWLWRMLVVAGWLVALSAPAVLIGWRLIASTVPVTPGVAWCAALAAGLLILVLTQQSRAHRDFTWYVARPELQ